MNTICSNMTSMRFQKWFLQLKWKLHAWKFFVKELLVSEYILNIEFDSKYQTIFNWINGIYKLWYFTDFWQRGSLKFSSLGVQMQWNLKRWIISMFWIFMKNFVLPNNGFLKSVISFGAMKLLFRSQIY